MYLNPGAAAACPEPARAAARGRYNARRYVSLTATHARAVTALSRSARRRLVLLGIASLLVHAALLWLPGIRVPRTEAPLPLLTAKLVPLPRRAKQPPARKPRARKPRAAPPPAPAAPSFALKQAELPQSAVAAASSVAAGPAVGASGVPATEAASAPVASMPASAPAATTTGAEDYAATAASPPALPAHARLRFMAMAGSYRIYAGEIRHDLEIKDGHYTLHAELETKGLARLIKRYQNIQDSRGTATKEHGLRPDSFTEAKTDEHGTQHSEADFDWSAHRIRFASGASSPLPEGSQDILSFLYQLSQLPYNKTTLPLAISNGRKLEYYRLETGPEETIDSPIGKLVTLHLTKVHKPNEEGMEIWLAREYRLLPVKVRYYERDGSLAAEVLIREIRASDE